MTYQKINCYYDGRLDIRLTAVNRAHYFRTQTLPAWYAQSYLRHALRYYACLITHPRRTMRQRGLIQ